MKNDDLSWLSAELGLPVFEETASGLLVSPAGQASSAAVAWPQVGAPTIEASVAALTGLAVDHPVLVAAIAGARAGQRSNTLLGPNEAGESWQLLAAPVGAISPFGEPSRVRITLAPAAARATRNEGLVEVAAAVSHEVANAVGSIRGWAELALHGDDAAVDVRDALTLIRGAARNAEQAARSMLALARGEAEGADGEPPQALDVSAFAGELLQLATLTARQARVTLESSIEPGLFVRASRAQLFTIIFNLIKNAIEACPHGGLVSVHVRGDRDHVRVSVRDTGPGLDAQARKRIFDRYYTTKSSGTGLGLALVQSAVAASQGRLELDSEPGRGSVFRVTLARASEHSAVAEVVEDSWLNARSVGDPASGHGLDLRVLVVDDDHALREMLATALSLRGADVISVRSSREALELEGIFDIALIDMMLDDCRGDELLATLRQRGVVNAAMLVTGTVQKPRLVPGGEPDDWVRKPFELSQLVERIRRTLERHRMLDDASHIARA